MTTKQNGFPKKSYLQACLESTFRRFLCNTRQKRLKVKNKKVETLLNNLNPQASQAFEELFNEWTEQVIRMRLIQEYETIKGLLVTAALAKTVGIPSLENAMAQVQDKFGRDTVNIALDVTLKVGMRREKLQSIMLSDH